MTLFQIKNWESWSHLVSKPIYLQYHSFLGNQKEEKTIYHHRMEQRDTDIYNLEKKCWDT